MNKELVPSVVAIFLLASVHLAAAQQQANVRRVGFLGNASAAAINVFRQGLRDTGWVDGQNIAIQYRSYQEKNALLPGLAAELVQLNVDVIVATSTEPALAARQVTRTIPIVMVGLADPVEAGLVISLARPGGNVTGLSNVNTELGGKRLELLKEAFPKVSSVAVLWRSASAGQQQQMKAIEIAARSLQVKLQPVAAEGPSDFERAFSSMKTERASALITLASSVFGNSSSIDCGPRGQEPAASDIPIVHIHRGWGSHGIWSESS